MQAEEEVRLLRLPEVEHRVGLKRAAIYARIALGTFPKQIQLGPRSVAWSSTAIEAYIQARIAAPYVKPEKAEKAEARAAA